MISQKAPTLPRSEFSGIFLNVNGQLPDPKGFRKQARFTAKSKKQQWVLNTFWAKLRSPPDLDIMHLAMLLCKDWKHKEALEVSKHQYLALNWFHTHKNGTVPLETWNAALQVFSKTASFT